MSLLSDTEIEELCTRPTHKWVTPTDPNNVVDLGGGVSMSTLAYFDPTPYQVELTEEELAAWHPMISPFKPELVRYVSAMDAFDHSRGPYYKQPYPEGVRDHQYLPERKIISMGLTSYGYDVSLSDKEIKLFTNINSTIIDPKRLDERCLVDADIKTDEDGARYVILPPNSYMLGHTVEYFHMPNDALAVCLGKSTYARAGIAINATPIEPGWHGNVVIEILNGTSLPAKIYVNEGISQFLFFRGNKPCRVSYADRGGKYLGQTGTTLPKA